MNTAREENIPTNRIILTNIIILFIKIKKTISNDIVLIYQWGGIWGSNPCIPEPQSGVLTTSPTPPGT